MQEEMVWVGVAESVTIRDKHKGKVDLKKGEIVRMSREGFNAIKHVFPEHVLNLNKSRMHICVLSALSRWKAYGSAA